MDNKIFHPYLNIYYFLIIKYSIPNHQFYRSGRTQQLAVRGCAADQCRGRAPPAAVRGDRRRPPAPVGGSSRGGRAPSGGSAEESAAGHCRGQRRWSPLGEVPPVVVDRIGKHADWDPAPGGGEMEERVVGQHLDEDERFG
jgi:hypothetical protein